MLCAMGLLGISRWNPEETAGNRYSGYIHVIGGIFLWLRASKL